MGKALAERVGKLETRVENLEKAVVEQGGVIAKYSAMVKLMEEQANDLPAAVRTAVDELWSNQRTMEWQIATLLHLIDPDNFPDPEPLKEESTDAVPGEAGPEAVEAEGPETPEGPEAARPNAEG